MKLNLVRSLLAVGALCVLLPAAATASSGSTGAIAIANTIGAASPYPAQLFIPDAGKIVDVNVRINGLTISNPHSLDIAIRSPDQTIVEPISDCMGALTQNATVVLDDEAPGPAMIQGGTFPYNTTSTYKPQDCDGFNTTDNYPLLGNQPNFPNALSTFDGHDASGTWGVYVTGDENAYPGTIQSVTIEVLTDQIFTQQTVTFKEFGNGGDLPLSFTRAGGLPAASFGWQIVEGTAETGKDVVQESGTVSFAEGDLTATATVHLLDDAITEDFERFKVKLTPGPNAGLTIPDIDVTLLDDDDPSAVSGFRAFRSTAPLGIPTVGIADPYPSKIDVTGVPRPITGLEVQLDGLTHPFSGQVAALLVGPGGQKVLLTRSALGGITLGNELVTSSDTVRFATGGAPLPTAGVPELLSGTYAPEDRGSGDLTAPAPAGPYGVDLGVFTGTDANGTWRLYVEDSATSPAGALAGWTLRVRTTPDPAVVVPQPTPTPTPGPGVIPTPAPTPTPKPQVATCKVPKLAGLTLAQAKAKLKKARCVAGRTTKPKAKLRKGYRLVVKTQTVKAGRTVPAGTKVAVTLKAVRVKKQRR